ncbi:magnesium transporter CorA family protein [Sporosarcina trichiuri]|uniref:magnesium transporter CorA family protein n=1 Tax=Sporosarcina trichiuri TaxID=3056445 RepID=UPI0025B2C0EA|nr:magnesium transporter CorA family protein [Sporosarcina sp. 0.2-SM1T-5]WJY27555.1 magnesium transporter CorA family protein [Sporosarcina sp. 0.2-SM1T-5]
MLEPAFEHKNWTWHRLDNASPQNIAELPGMSPAGRRWAQSLYSGQNSNLEMETDEPGSESMWGSIVYSQNLEERNRQTILHFYVSQGLLLTYGIEPAVSPKLSAQHLLKSVNGADNAIEGFMALLGEIVAVFLMDIESFEDRMHALLWRIKEKNDEPVFEEIMENRHEILVWKNLIIPVIEIREAAQEAFGKKIADGPHFERTCLRIRRCRQTIRDYDDEVGKLIDLESVISSHRGNEIVKTLTVITMLFTPVAAWGALWGMNFSVMPELKWRYGYIASLLVILLSTWALYYYLKKKNWIGSVLKSPKNRKF